ncbi:unnamed protein product [Caenorhabditis brenneri]
MPNEVRPPRQLPMIPIRGGTVYIPPGRDHDIRKWDREDTDLWLACFLRPDLYPETFLAATKQHLDGESMYWLVTKRDTNWQAQLEIPPEQYKRIMESAAAVVNERNNIFNITEKKKFIESRKRAAEENGEGPPGREERVAPQFENQEVEEQVEEQIDGQE